MDAHEIVVHEVDRHHVIVVRGFLRKGIREPRHAPVAHPHRKILALRKRRAHMDVASAFGSGLRGRHVLLPTMEQDG